MDDAELQHLHDQLENLVNLRAMVNQLDYLEKVLNLVKDDMCSILIHKVDGQTRICFLCNDLFAWACADAEEILPEDIPLLEELYSNPNLEKTGYVPEMFCCKKRGVRPQAAYYKGCPPEAIEFFDSCGPERTDEFK